MQWGPAPPVLPGGAQIAVLEGNPAEKGPITLRLKFPANYNIPAHWHSMAEHLTVLSGHLPRRNGRQARSQGQPDARTGRLCMLPANMRHFAWTTAPTVVQINLEGPFDLFYVNPADNPQPKTNQQ